MAIMKEIYIPQYGVIKALRMPRSRDGFITQIIPHYQRNLARVNQMVRNIFLADVSTRRGGEVLSNLWDREVSTQRFSGSARVWTGK
jgi:hypothetical protein